MRDDLTKDLLPRHGEAIDPVAMARRDLARKLPERFYKAAGVDRRDGGFALVLDGKGAKTPGRNPLALPNQAVAELVAAEWEAQTERIDPATMPMTRLVNSAIDGVASNADAVRAEIVKYAGSDLLCYRAGEPDGLVAAQTAIWDPILDGARAEIGARFVLSQGIVFVAQPEATIDAMRVATALVPAAAPLAALSAITTLTGSAVLALALARGRLDAEAAWTAAHVDEDFQMQIWGFDDEALARRAKRWTEMSTAALLYRLTVG